LHDHPLLRTATSSGNPLATDFFPNQALYSLAYLEAAACKLSTWPRNLAQRMPNLRHVNLNYNFLKDLKGLSGLQGLRKLSLIGARLGETGSREIISDLRGLGTLESVDIRSVTRFCFQAMDSFS
jgi:hypothetical protein